MEKEMKRREREREDEGKKNSFCNITTAREMIIFSIMMILWSASSSTWSSSPFFRCQGQGLHYGTYTHIRSSSCLLLITCLFSPLISSGISSSNVLRCVSNSDILTSNIHIIIIIIITAWCWGSVATITIINGKCNFLPSELSPDSLHPLFIQLVKISEEIAILIRTIQEKSESWLGSRSSPWDIHSF